MATLYDHIFLSQIKSDVLIQVWLYCIVYIDMIDLQSNKMKNIIIDKLIHIFFLQYFL
jgi:hypothetical protein